MNEPYVTHLLARRDSFEFFMKRVNARLIEKWNVNADMLPDYDYFRDYANKVTAETAARRAVEKVLR